MAEEESWMSIVQQKILKNGDVRQREDLNLRVESLNNLPEYFIRLMPPKGIECLVNFDVKRVITEKPFAGTTKGWREPLQQAIDTWTNFMTANENILKLYAYFLRKYRNKKVALINMGYFISVCRLNDVMLADFIGTGDLIKKRGFEDEDFIAGHHIIKYVAFGLKNLWNFIDFKIKDVANAKKINKELQELKERTWAANTWKEIFALPNFAREYYELSFKNKTELIQLFNKYLEMAKKRNQILEKFDLKIEEGIEYMPQDLTMVIQNEIPRGRKIFSDEEYFTIRKVIEDPKLMITYNKEVFMLLTRGMARLSGAMDFQFNYDIALILGNNHVTPSSLTQDVRPITWAKEERKRDYKKEEPFFYAQWGNIDITKITPKKFNETYLGIICLLNNRAFFKSVIQVMLKATENSPALRMPIYSTAGRLIWPEKM